MAMRYGTGKWSIADAHLAASFCAADGRRASEMSNEDISRAWGLAQGEHGPLFSAYRSAKRRNHTATAAKLRAMIESWSDGVRALSAEIDRRHQICREAA